MKPDYIIIGGGTAGCILASRLTENRETEVLLLEAGGPDTSQDIHIPANFAKLLKSECDWKYFTEPQAELNNRKLYTPQGRVLGGSSSINAMIYVRGSKFDYDQWNALGNAGWSYKEVLPYFKKAESTERAGASSEYHGFAGPLGVSEARYVNPLTRAFVAAGVQMGLAQSSDFNEGVQEGVGVHLTTQKGGQRHSTAEAYLKPIERQRSNLTIVTNALVTRLVVNGSNRAVGVRYERQNVGGTKEENQAEAEKEVIVCCGAIGSPHLLMVSGIGPREHLRETGVEVVKDLPGVGENLQDHLRIGLAYRCTKPVSLLNLGQISSRRNRIRYFLFRNGPLTSNIAEAGAFLKTEPDLPAPDIQIGFAPMFNDDRGLNPPNLHAFAIGCWYLRPKSRGKIRLKTRDPHDSPLIQPRFLTDPEDITHSVRGLKFCRELVKQSSFDPFRGEYLSPTPQVKDEDDDEGLVEYIRANSRTVDHPSCTCKMGKENDPMAVVDSKLHVYGIEGLRVVDASIMPTIVSGNTNAAVIMIAEKAADIITKDLP